MLFVEGTSDFLMAAEEKEANIAPVLLLHGTARGSRGGSPEKSATQSQRQLAIDKANVWV